MDILIISSLTPFQSANYGKRIIDIFNNAGFNVDYLTKYKFDGMTENMIAVYDEVEPVIQNITVNAKSNLKYYLFARFPFVREYFERKNISQSVIPLREEEPEVDAQLLCDKITKHYDVVLVLFWQYMLTTKTLKMIYDKLHVPILLNTVDMYPMTGGCYYFNDCRNYRNECKECPAASLFKKQDIPHQNFLYKKQVYQSINCVYFCNKWMREHILESGIIQEKKLKPFAGAGNPSFLIEDNKFDLRKELKLPENKFIMFAGAANVRIRRKGFYELVASVNRFVGSIKKKADVVIVLAGRNDENFQKYFRCKVIHMGFLPTERLAKMYRAADLYLSSSLDDAGPSMVIQSMLCGTPVVAFNVGIAPEEIRQGKTGYVAKMGDVKDFASGIKYFYNFDHKEREKVSLECRQSMIKDRNPQAFLKAFMDLYEEFKEPKA